MSRRGGRGGREEQSALARVETGGSNVSPHVTQEGEGSRTRDEDNVATWLAADKDEAVSKRLLELMADGGGGSIWDIAFFGAKGLVQGRACTGAWGSFLKLRGTLGFEGGVSKSMGALLDEVGGRLKVLHSEVGETAANWLSVQFDFRLSKFSQVAGAISDWESRMEKERKEAEAQRKARESDLREMDDALGGDCRGMGHEQRAQRLRRLAEKEEKLAAEAKGESARAGGSRDRSSRPRAKDWMEDSADKDSADKSSAPSESKDEADRRRREEWDELDSEDDGLWEELEPQASPGFSKGVQVLVYPPEGHRRKLPVKGVLGKREASGEYNVTVQTQKGPKNIKKMRGLGSLVLAEAEPDASSFGEESSKGKQVEKRRPEDFMDAMGRTTWLCQVCRYAASEVAMAELV